MLDILTLEKQFDKILDSFTEKELRKWLAFSEEREMFEKLKKGEIVTIKLNVHQVVNQKISSKNNINIADTYLYAMSEAA